MAERPPPSEQELEILKVIWDEGPSTVRGVDEVLRARGVQRIYTHLQTLLNRLQAKGHVSSEPKSGALAHVYRAVSTREDLLRDRLQDLADQLCEGATTPLVLTLVEGHAFSDEEIARLRALLSRKRTQDSGLRTRD
jgi:BlaI family transcriptional regulator, penicillinase repressor